MTDSILIIGGGIAGLTAAEQCAAAGARAIVVERDAIVGGRLAAAMTEDSSVGSDIDGVPVPKLAALADNENIEFLTLAELEDIDGRPGNFSVTLRQHPRFVTDACTLCNRCRPVCPVVLPNEHDAGLTYRKAIYTPLAETLPQEFVIDIDSCLNTPPNYLPCNRCTEVCDDDAIFFDVALESTHTRQVGAVIVAAGFATGISAAAAESGYGSHADVVTTAEMERLLTAPGPTGGFAARPSNEDYPDSVLFIVDPLTSFETQTAASQIRRLLAQDVGTIGCLITAQADALDTALPGELPAGVAVNHGLLTRVEADDDDRLAVTWADFSSSRVPEEHYDMVVLDSTTQPADGLGDLAEVLGIELVAATGYVAAQDVETGCGTSRPGIYVAGAAAGPVMLPEAVAHAYAAATAAVAQLDPRVLEGAETITDSGELTAGGLTEEEVKARIKQALLAMLE